MAALRVFLPLAICFLLGHQTFAYNGHPCQNSQRKDGFEYFLKNHILKHGPTPKGEEWNKHIDKDPKCTRSRQSFLGHDMLEKVKAVCTEAGGKTHDKNMCISREEFTFKTVIFKTGTCTFKEVIDETKHLILACDKLDNGCLPVHFEGNPGNLHPKVGAGGCLAPPE